MAVENICAKTHSQLNLTPRLKTLAPILPTAGQKGFVNETKGSFLYIEAQPSHFKIFFLTSGLFDLYSIVRDGEVTFCDTGENLVIIGLGRTRVLMTKGEGIQFGDGGASESFQPGPVPKELQQLYGLPIMEAPDRPTTKVADGV